MEVFQKVLSRASIKPLRQRAFTQVGYQMTKRAFDVVFSGFAITILLIPSTILAIAIKTDSNGPVIYKRWCVGKDGEPFPMYKFRTMRIEPPEEILSPEQYEQWKREIKVDDDPRVTRVGKAIRPYSIDELPQFLNVLKGEMSVVGPRPVTAEEAEMYGELKSELLSVKPGITGYWQVFGRDDTSYDADSSRLKMQLHYARNATAKLDLEIVVRTVVAVFKRTGK